MKPVKTRNAGRAPRGRKGTTRPPSKQVIRRHRRRADICPATGKIRWRDHEEAIRALHTTQNAKATATFYGAESRRNENRAYACVACSGWHLTSWKTFRFGSAA
jgi:hypothetical protein